MTWLSVIIFTVNALLLFEGLRGYQRFQVELDAVWELLNRARLMPSFPSGLTRRRNIQEPKSNQEKRETRRR